MDRAFMQILNMSVVASVVILFVLLARVLLKKAPKIFSYILWSAVFFRLICPFSFESEISLIPGQIPVQPKYDTYSLLDKDIPFRSALFAAYEAVGDAANGGLGTITIYLEPEVEGETNYTFAMHSDVWILFGQYLWVFGIAALIIYSVVSLIRLKLRLVGAVKWQDKIYFADRIPSPFVLGVFRPKIYLPSALDGEEREYILLHEQTHIRRRDYIFKIIAFFAVVLHWFNPLAWVAYRLFVRDMEMSCDENVMKNMNTDIRGKYSASLLSLATGKRIIAGTPLAFGEGDTKNRIKNVMSYKKPALWVIIAAIIVVAALTIGFAANRQGASDPEIPEVFAIDDVSKFKVVTALQFGYSWSNGERGVVADAIAPWEGEYTDENTFVLPIGIWENALNIDILNAATSKSSLYLSDGTEYQPPTVGMDEEKKITFRLTDDRNTSEAIVPVKPGEYFYVLTLGWEKNNLTVTYGIKLVIEGEEWNPQPIRDLDEHFAAVSKANEEMETLTNRLTVQDIGDYENIALMWMSAWIDMYKALPEDSVAYIANGAVDVLEVTMVSKEGEPKAFVFYVYASVQPTYPIGRNGYWMAGNTRPSPDRDSTWGQLYMEVELILMEDGQYHLSGTGAGGVGNSKGYIDLRVKARAAETLYDAFYQLVLHLYKMDSGLNPEIKYIAIDMTGVPESATALLEAELRMWAKSLGCELLIDTYAGLVESGKISEHAGFKDGLLFQFDSAVFDGETMVVNVSKYRAPLGAVGAEFTVRFSDWEWVIEEPTAIWMA